MSDEFELPGLDERTLVTGRTGSGKTQLGAFLLSRAPFDRQPFIIVDYKRDALLNASNKIREIGYNEVPKHPGLYIIHPEPTPAHDIAVNNWLLKVWRRHNVGLFFDEIYMVPDKEGLAAILTQGRSLRIPAIINTQRPAWLSRFALSEADHFAVFHLNDSDDRKKIGRFLPPGAADTVPPEYNSIWYSVKRHKLFHLQPVPDASTILTDIEARLTPRRRVI
jgi:hypothetical protein